MVRALVKSEICVAPRMVCMVSTERLDRSENYLPSWLVLCSAWQKRKCIGR